MFRLGYVGEAVVGHEQFIGRLAIPYLTRAGVVNIKFRCLDHEDCKPSGCKKYLGLPLPSRLYNVEAFFSHLPYIGVTEGEFDSEILTALVEIPSVSVPGATAWRPHYSRCFLDYERVLVFADGDQPGRDFAKHLSRTLDAVTTVQMPEGMDVNQVYLAEGASGLRRRAGLSG